MKVYCINCRHFIAGECIPFSYGPPDTIRQLCMAPQNFKDNHVEPDALPISSPKVINRFNDCVWYEPIEEPSSTSSSSSSSSCSFITDMP